MNKQNYIKSSAHGILIVLAALLITILAGVLTGCKEEVTLDPVISDTQVESVTYTAFKSTIDGINYFTLDADYTCTDNVLYQRPATVGGLFVQITGADGVADTCDPLLWSVTLASEGATPIYGL